MDGLDRFLLPFLKQYISLTAGVASSNMPRKSFVDTFLVVKFEYDVFLGNF